MAAQRRFLTATKIRLFGLLGAAAFGLFTWQFGTSPTDWAGVAAAICFGAALVVEGYLLKTAPERTWYEGRAAAESVKTLSWRYAVGGEPFNIGVSDNQVDDLFLRQLDEILEVLKKLEVTPASSEGEQVSATMRALRNAPLADRKKVYEEARVGDQQNWYQRKAKWNSERAGQWTIGVLTVEIAGVVAAVLKAVGVLTGNLLGFAGALVAAIMAWSQTKQHRALATAYSVTALELASVRTKIHRQNDEADWAKFVSDAEEAFSREHTLWKASRGVRSI